MLTLPVELQNAVRAALADTRPDRWMRAAQALSERYRGERAQPGPLVGGDLQALAYAALLLPATYAQLHGAMAAAQARAPGFAPRLLLDIGSGPGTALWAAAARWPSLETMVAWEREPAFLTLGRRLAAASAAPAVRGARWQRVDLRQVETTPAHPFDLVVLAHVLNELEPEERRQAVSLAWRLTGGLLLIVEPGASAAFAIVRAARDQLLAAGAHTIAPCVHDAPCPLADDWCHFPQRLKRPDFQRRARGAPSEWEDAKYSYAAMARFAPERPAWGRVIREVVTNKGYAEAVISTAGGIGRYRALKRHREAFRALKEVPWGAALEQPPAADEIPEI